MHLVVEQRRGLGRRLVDPVDVDRLQRVVLVQREVARAPVLLSRARVDDPRLRPLPPERLEHGELRPVVELQVEERVGHRVDVTDVAGDAEDDVLALDELVGGLANVLRPNREPALDRRDVEAVASELRHEAVGHGHLGAELDEPDREVRADEAEPARHEHAAALRSSCASSSPRRSGGRGASGPC